MRSLASVAVIAAGLATALLAPSAVAQWMWKDDAGKVVASDQPPPPSVPASHIMKTPRKRTPDQAAVEPPKDAAKDGADAPKSLADRDLEFKQRQKEAAEAAKKAEAEAAKAQGLKENCAALRGNLAALQTGGRAARTDANGERSYIDDAQRQSEIERTQAQLSQNCK
jgi:outer membrane biosynthesis protein TonB